MKDVNEYVLKGSEGVQRRLAEYFNEVLDVGVDREASIVPVGGERKMPVVGE